MRASRQISDGVPKELRHLHKVDGRQALLVLNCTALKVEGAGSRVVDVRGTTSPRVARRGYVVYRICKYGRFVERNILFVRTYYVYV